MRLTEEWVIKLMCRPWTVSDDVVVAVLVAHRGERERLAARIVLMVRASARSAPTGALLQS